MNAEFELPPAQYEPCKDVYPRLFCALGEKYIPIPNILPVITAEGLNIKPELIMPNVTRSIAPIEVKKFVPLNQILTENNRTEPQLMPLLPITTNVTKKNKRGLFKRFVCGK